MKTTTRSFLSQAIATLACIAICTSSVFAASIDYGDVNDIPPGTVTFKSVTESSGTDPVPLYSAPNAVANNLIFRPLGFTSNSAGGGADITDGQLNFGLVAKRGTAFSDVSLSEGGDYTLFGAGTAVTSAATGLFMRVTIVEVDGMPIAPISAEVSVQNSYDLIANPGVAQGWNMAAAIDLEQTLTDANQAFTLGATKADVFLNNTLLSISETTAVAFIAKKDFVIGVTPVVPEPMTSLLLLSGLSLLVANRRQLMI